MEVSDISDVEVVAEVDEEPQDAWLNDLLKADGDGVSKSPVQLASMETTELEDQLTFSSKFCAFTSENSVISRLAVCLEFEQFLLKALLGIGIATLAITIIAKLRK